MKPIKLLINTESQKYPIFIGENLVSSLMKIAKKNSIKFEKCLLVIDKKVPTKMLSKIKRSLKNKKIIIYNFNANEKNKNQKTINNITKLLLKNNFSRKDCLISVGGGITGDIGGFASSIFKRGLYFINIPTTLLSQVDSSVGGKTGINTEFGKNLIGSFYQPKLVISDSDFLKSLPRREIICGYGEILKHSLISNKNFYKFLYRNIFHILKLKSPYIEKAIFESCKIKKLIVERDEKENELRKILNFGHTFAHAYEASLGFSKKLNHGEAVLLGISTALNFSYKKKLLNQNNYDSIINHLKVTGLPFNVKKYFSKKDIIKIVRFMTKDKKNYSSKINLILLKKIGTPIINNEYNKTEIKLFFNKLLAN
tara:strand:+ start:416 stop:1522 length:1107 start_codon:yes stop_codon:yes gene_type:complete